VRKLGLVLLVALRGACSPPPPAQVVEPLPSPSASASADPDISGPGGEAPPPPPPPPMADTAFQPVQGSLGGAPWELKGAGTVAAVKSDGTVLVLLANYNIDCGPHTPAPGEGTIAVAIPWAKGTKVDLGTLKGKDLAAASFDEKRKKPVPVKGWKPKGTIEVLSAPNKVGSSGRIRIDLSSGSDGIKAEIPVKLCFAS
jgi:hypothetical protein